MANKIKTIVDRRFGTYLADRGLLPESELIDALDRQASARVSLVASPTSLV